MAVPKKRTSSSVRNMRRSHDALTPKFSSICSNCGAMTLWHRVCQECGFYRGRKVMDVKNNQPSA